MGGSQGTREEARHASSGGRPSDATHEQGSSGSGQSDRPGKPGQSGRSGTSGRGRDESGSR
jgi:hypothetical protein